MRKMLSKSFISVAFAMMVMNTAQALPISETHTITASGVGSVGYTTFSVTSAGNFDIFTQGPTTDPQLFLFQDGDANGILGSAALDPFIATDDDGCPDTQCGPAGSFSNSLIDEIALGIGNYIAAVSDFGFDEGEARAGNNINNLIGDIDIVIAAGSTDAGGAEAVLTTTVPEPGSLAMLGFGLLAGGLMVNRRRKRADAV